MKYAYSTDQENYEGEFDSREEAALEAFASDEDAETAWIGIMVTPPRRPNAEWLIEKVAEDTTEESGEWSDGYLENIPDEAKAELQFGLQKLWDEWEAKWKLEPQWFNINASREHSREDFEDQLKDDQA